jgi:predicted ATPase
VVEGLSDSESRFEAVRAAALTDLIDRENEIETALTHALAQLEQAELVFRRGEPPEAVYSFKHALVRDAAYVARRRRCRAWHRRSDTRQP